DGTTIFHEGIKVKIDPRSLEPRGDAHKNPPADGTRSHASQIFQVTAVNLGHAKTNPKIEYLLLEPDHKSKPPNTTGEYLIDNSVLPAAEVKGQDEKPARAPDLHEDQIAGISNMITGKNETDVVIVHERNFSGKAEDVTKI